MASTDIMLNDASRLYPHDPCRVLALYRSAVMLKHLSLPVKMLALQVALCAILFLVA